MKRVTFKEYIEAKKIVDFFLLEQQLELKRMNMFDKKFKDFYDRIYSPKNLIETYRMNLPARLRNCLIHENFEIVFGITSRYFHDVVDCYYEKKEEFFKIKGFGKSTMRDLENAVNDYQKHFKKNK